MKLLYIVPLYLAFAVAQSSADLSHAPEPSSSSLSDGGAIVLYNCVGYNQTTACHTKVTNNCTLTDEACNCKYVNAIFNTCFSDDLLDPGKCGSDIRSKRDYWKQNSINGCKANNYTVDEGNGGNKGQNSGANKMVFGGSLTAIFILSAAFLA